MRRSPQLPLSKLTLLAFTIFASNPAAAQTPLLIWPIDPVIETNQKNTSLWLENKGQSLSIVQITVLKWDQSGGEDHLTEQEDVVLSPPMAQIRPGSRQFIRLMRADGAPIVPEGSYRVLIEEVPTARTDSPESGGAVGAGIRFHMRYSLPLFIYGGAPSTAQDRAKMAPALRCAISGNGPEQTLQITNDGSTHVRLTNISVEQADATSAEVPGGQLSYILPGATMRWKLPSGVRQIKQISAGINAANERARLPECTRG